MPSDVDGDARGSYASWRSAKCCARTATPSCMHARTTREGPQADMARAESGGVQRGVASVVSSERKAQARVADATS